MEPTIYKPGAYNSPGIYNGDGSLYNGLGVYLDGSGASDLILYETDFSNFDLANKIDYPRIGSQKSYSIDNSHFEITNITVDGISYNALKHKTGSGDWVEVDFSELENENLYTIEFIVYKPTFTGVGAYTGVVNSDASKRIYTPYLNCFSASRGFGLGSRPTINVLETYNNFSFSFEYYYYSSLSETKSISGVCVSGVTIDKDNGFAKTYIRNKKGLKINLNDSYNNLVMWSDSNMEFYWLGFRIIKKDLFEEME